MLDLSSGDSRKIISNLVAHMESKGLQFKKINLDDNSPYAILNSGTSIGYRTKSKWNKTGVVFFCSKDKVDSDNISRILNLEIDDNKTDSARPYALFVPDSKVEQAISILAQNPTNTGASKEKKKVSKAKKNSYQSTYWDQYFPYVKQALARDGYSNSDSNTETTVRDTFYLERKDDADFMSWFESPETLERAKQRLVELLTAANRQSSNLKTDIKYYTRDITYFYEFIKLEKGENLTSQIEPKYKFIKYLKNKMNVSLVKNTESGQFYVKKQYEVYNREVFERLQKAHIEGLPEIIEVQQIDNTLYTIEEFIDGDTLLEIHENKGRFNEQEIKYVALEVCKILKKLHTMNPTLLHRDIKPSNIMMDKAGKIYVIDFNASKEVHENTSEDTVLYGTQYFGAPEQLLGYGVSTPATDVFGLGATLNYLMTGMYVTQMVVPGKIHDVIEKSTKIDWHDRYQSIEEMENAITKAFC